MLSTFTRECFDELVADSSHRVLLYEEEDHLRGFAVVNLESTFEDESYGYEVDTLYVQEHFQGRGIGQSLLASIADRFGSTFWLSTWVHNTDAIEFYRTYGFTDVGRVDFDLEGERHENRVLSFGRV